MQISQETIINTTISNVNKHVLMSLNYSGSLFIELT
jgi:hypothetical protein